MHPRKLEQISQALTEVAKTAEEPSDNSLPQRIHDGAVYNLPPESAYKYSEQVRALMGYDNFSHKFSEKHIIKELNKIFAELLFDESFDVSNGLQKLIKEFKSYNNPVKVYLALDGVQPKLSAQLGAVLLAPGDEQLLSALELEVNSIVEGVKADESSKQIYRQEFADECRKELYGRCVLIYEVNAEPVRASERAREEAGFAIDLLRFASKYLLPFNEDIRIGLRGERSTVRRSTFVLGESSLSTQHDAAGSILIFALDEEVISLLSKFGLSDLSSRYSKGQLSELDRALIRSIHWLSVALTQDEPETAIITLIVALESLFKAQPGSSITGTVAESTAFVLADKAKGRYRICKIIRGFYSKRSALSHGGKKVVTDSERILLLQYVSACIVTVLNHDSFESRDSLMKWIEEQKFGGIRENE